MIEVQYFMYIYILSLKNKSCKSGKYIETRWVHGTFKTDKVFADLDYADDVALLFEMLKIVTLSLKILPEETNSFGLEIN